MFYAICFNKQFEILQAESMKLKAAFSTSSVIIAIFSAIFIWYSNSFFIKRRKKEIGTYSLLGMGKKQIARMLFFESLILGLLALACGIFLGTLFSKLFAMILMNVMHETAKVTFFIAIKAVGITVIAFLIIFLVNSIHSYSLIYRFKLIDLFNASKQGERAPRVSVILSLISIFMIGTGYTIAVTLKKLSINKLLFILGITVLGTYILFSNLIIYLVKLIKKNRNYYFKGVNMIGISNILYRIKGNSRTLATIAVLSAVTITAVGTTYSLYSTIERTTLANYPYSAEYKLTGKDTDKKIDELIMKHSEVGISSIDEIEYLKSEVSIPGYLKDKAAKNFEGHILSESQFNEIVKHNKSSEAIKLEIEMERRKIRPKIDI
jgi:putative ABC transport system permease protein